MTSTKKPMAATVELGRRGGRARVAQLAKEEIRELGSRGGKARAARLSKEQLREISRRAIKARWARAKRAERP